MTGGNRGVNASDDLTHRRPVWPPDQPAAHAAKPGTVDIGGQTFIVLSSNDYLGLSGDPRVVAAARAALDTFGLGARAARSLGGDTNIHRELEEELAALKSTEAALVFNSGYMCNLGVISVLVGRGDSVVSDRLNHASIVDGARLSGANVRVYEHLDLVDLDLRLDESLDDAKTLVVTDTVFSMDGDLAPVDEIIASAREHGASVLLDDAHATGVLGTKGQGSTGHFDGAKHADVIVGTLGKALGSAGAFAAGSSSTIDALSEKARTFLFTTALPPAVVAGALESVRILQAEPDRVERLWANATALHSALTEIGFEVPRSVSPIISIRMGDEMEATRAARTLRDNGILVHPVVPPYVAPGTARLRVIVSSAHSQQQLESAFEVFLLVSDDLNRESR